MALRVNNEVWSCDPDSVLLTNQIVFLDLYFREEDAHKVVSVECIGLWKHNGVLCRLMEQNKTKHPLALSRVEPRVAKSDEVPMF